MRGLILTALIAALLPSRALGLPILRFSSDEGLSWTTITDNSASDTLTSDGGIIYNGPVGGGWTVAVTSGITKPITGSAYSPDMDTLVSVTSSGAGTLLAQLSETDFENAGAINFLIAGGGNSAGTVTIEAWASGANTPFTSGNLISSINASGAPFSANGAGILVISPAPRYSLTLQTKIVHAAAGYTSLDSQVVALNVPTPTPTATPTITPTPTATITPTPESLVPICFIPDGNPQNAFAKYIPASDLDSYLAAGHVSGLCVYDCKNVPLGTATVDKCGVCDGDNTSCLTCKEVDNLSNQFAMDGGSAKQLALIKQASKLLLKKGGNRAFRSFGQAAIAQAERLYRENWVTTWSQSRVVTVCDDPMGVCTTVSSAAPLSDYERNSLALHTLLKALVKKLAIYDKAGARKINSKGDKVYADGLKASGQVPGFESLCD